MIFESSEAAKRYTGEMIREYDSGSYVGVETSHEIDSVSLDNIIIGNLRERGSLKTQQGDNLHESIDDEESLSFEKARGVRKKLLRFSPRRGSKLRLISSTTSVLKNFLDTAEAEVKSLTTLYIEVGRSADSLSLYFGEDPARCPFEQDQESADFEACITALEDYEFYYCQRGPGILNVLDLQWKMVTAQVLCNLD
uniref:Blight resistance protein SH20 n=1 Tax=Solanum tuberosum TaxID=4113 RepID=M1BZN7_SOLTU